MNSFTYFIAAPFGNYLKFKDINNYQQCVSVTGTWTLKRRGGWGKRIYRIIKTLRYDSQLNGWKNQLGLPNEGLKHGLKNTLKTEVLSIAAIENSDWLKLNTLIPSTVSLELNLSCPNVDDTTVLWKDLAPFFLSNQRQWCIAKVSPLITLDQLSFLIENLGCKQLHLCNTLPLKEGGGLSGPILKKYVLSLIVLIRKHWGDRIEIISGGGVQNQDDVNQYLSTGANHISLGTVCFKPWKVNSLIKK